jgi:putative metallohydrolase (TIGR04338 family)
MTSPDPDKLATYRAEDRLQRWLVTASPSITVDVTTYTPEREARFVAPADVQRYVDRVLQHLRAGSKDYGGAEYEPVRVRPRRGNTRAEYGAGVMAIPPFEAGGSWALRESVILHELAHHLAGADGHGAAFRATFIRLLEDIGKPVWAELLHLAFISEHLEAVEHHVADDTIAKLAKVLRQAERASNEHERAAFLSKAQILATRHSIAFAVARAHTAATEQREQPVEETVVIGQAGKRGLARYVRLLLAIASANDLKALISSDSTRVYLIGFRSDIELAKALYESLLVQMVSDCAAYLSTDTETRHVPTITRRLAFYEGYGARIGERLLRARTSTHAKAVDALEPELSTATALAVKAKEVEVSDHFAEILRKQNIRSSWRGNRQPSWHSAPESYDAGSSAASRARIGRERALGA